MLTIKQVNDQIAQRLTQYSSLSTGNHVDPVPNFMAIDYVIYSKRHEQATLYARKQRCVCGILSTYLVSAWHNRRAVIHCHHLPANAMQSADGAFQPKVRAV